MVFLVPIQGNESIDKAAGIDNNQFGKFMVRYYTMITTKKN